MFEWNVNGRIHFPMAYVVRDVFLLSNFQQNIWFCWISWILCTHVTDLVLLPSFPQMKADRLPCHEGWQETMFFRILKVSNELSSL